MDSALLDIPALASAACVAGGLTQTLAGWLALRRFESRPVPPLGAPPPVTILKPLHGDEPLLEEALASFFRQDYPRFQLVFGLHDASDPALAVLRRLRCRFPDADVTVVIDASIHGSNRKVSNLINMFPAARHDVLVISDSDIHVAPDYLARLASTLAEPKTGLVTTIYSGLAPSGSLAGQLGSEQITHSFLPGALLARVLGRQDCLGATMALRRETLEAAGGFAALANDLADDAVLGRLVRAQGLAVRLAPTVPATTVPETQLSALFQHELRWARTIQSVAPVGFALSSLQHPLFWSTLCMALAGGEEWSVALFVASWLARGLAAAGVDRLLKRGPVAPIWLLPLRDILSATVILASYCSDSVHWRGQRLSASRPTLAPGEG